MDVPHDRARLVHNDVSGVEHAEEHVEIPAPARARANVQPWIEATERFQRGTAERHVRSGSDAPRIEPHTGVA
jgi:hypothetical protein